jgi:multiple sugar transport system ATP-binding protein
MASISLRHVDKTYANGHEAVHDLNLEVIDGEFLVLVGPSGCGKSTALRMIAGLEDISGGEILLDDTVVNDIPPKSRDIAMVFQSYALYPHMTVRDNIGFALKLRGVGRREREASVERVAASLQLADQLTRRPGTLSGGQRQRVAMGRAIVRQPKAFLMDEPLSNLDAKLRVQMRGEIARLQRRLGVTTVYVTHDQTEAMTMGDRVAVLSGGVLQQVDRPQALYDEPANLFVATFIGSPQMNLLRGRIRRGADDVLTVVLGRFEFRLPDSVVHDRPRLRDFDGVEIAFGIRPANIVEAAGGQSEQPTVKGTVELREGLGAESLIHVRLDVPTVDPSNPLFIARLAPDTRLQIDSTASLALDLCRASFFDLEDGLAITR